MPQTGILTGLTLEELKEMTEGQINAAQSQALNEKDRKGRIEFELQATEFSETPTIETGPHGQILKLTQICDAEETLLKKDKCEWTYYDTGEVDVITVSKFDPEDQVISQKKIKHFKNGKQPIILERERHGYKPW